GIEYIGISCRLNRQQKPGQRPNDVMNPLDMDEVQAYISDRLAEISRYKTQLVREACLETLFSGDPYLLRTKNIHVASDLIEYLLDDFLSSSEEKLLGDFLEGLALFVAEKTCGGHKSAAPGMDLEFLHHNVHYVVSIKSGPNWGNSSQQHKLEQDLK